MIGFGFSLTGLFTLARPSVTQAPPAAPIDLSISATRVSGVAPMGVIFEAIATGGDVADPFKDLYYVWEFGDPGATYPAIDPGHLNGNDANSATGPAAAHVFATPGTRTVTVRAYWFAGGAVQSQATSISITALDVDAEFASSETVVVSLTSDFADAPAGATQVSSIAALLSEIPTRNFDSKFRLLFHVGETFEFDNSAIFLRNIGDLFIGSYGTGAKPIISRIGRTDLNVGNVFRIANCNRSVVTGIDFYGGYDPENHTLTGTYQRQNVQIDTFDDTTVWDCSFRGMSIALYAFQFNTDFEGTLVVGGCEIRDWFDYGSLVSLGHFASIGNLIKQHPNAAFGVVGKGENTSATEMRVDHGPIRSSSTSLTKDPTLPKWDIHHNNDYFSRGGWSAYNTTTAHQPCLRVSMDAEGNNRRPVITQNQLEGGATVIGLSDASFSRDYGNADILVEGNFLQGDEQTDSFISVGMFGATVRNNVAHKPDLPEDGVASGGSYDNFFAFHRPNTTQIGIEAETQVTFNTVISDQTVANTDFSSEFFVLKGTSPITNTVSADNIVRATGSSNVANFPNDDPLDAANFYRPLAGSSALGAATLSPPLTDFAGNFRNPVSTARGAWHSNA